MKYKCPLCGSSLTEAHYHRVLKLQERTQRVQKGALARLMKQVANANAAAAAAKRREHESRARNKEAVETAKKEGVLAERKKYEIRDKRLTSKIRKLEEEKKMLLKHTSPQEIGLADEGVLVKKLQKEFPDDQIKHAGKGGDVLHYVRFDEANAGCIVYECKHTDRISNSHIDQTALAKKTRHADYGILVTTGKRKGFSGLDQESGVFLVAQAAVITLARICRESLVTMAKQRLDAAAKAATAKRLMDYVTSPICRTPLEEAITHTERAHRNLQKEVRQHVSDWKERHQLYQTIHYDISHFKTNIDRVLSGDEPLKLEKPKFEPLALPGRSEEITGAVQR